MNSILHILFVILMEAILILVAAPFFAVRDCSQEGHGASAKFLTYNAPCGNGSGKWQENAAMGT